MAKAVGNGKPGAYQPRPETILSRLNLMFVPIMSLLRQNIPFLLNGLDINTLQLTGYESTFLKITVWHGNCL